MKKFYLRRANGAALVEYGMLAGLIAVVSIMAVSNLGGEVRGTYQGVTSTLQDNLGSAPQAAAWNDFAADTVTGVEFQPGPSALADWYGYYEAEPYGSSVKKTGAPEIVGVNYNDVGDTLHVNVSSIPVGFKANNYITCRTQADPDIFTAPLAGTGEASDSGYPYMIFNSVIIAELSRSNTGGNTDPVICEIRPN